MTDSGQGMEHGDHGGALDALLNETRVFRPGPRTLIEANVRPDEIEAARAEAAADPLGYWEQAALSLEWFRKWDTVRDDTEAPFYRWFAGARTNIAHNALDRHVTTGVKNRLALIWEGEPGDRRTMTYYELYREVGRLAAALRGLGIGRGDRVALYLPALPETVAAMLAVARVGAAHVAVFAGFSARVLRERLCASRARALITADGFYRGGRLTPLKAVVDEALLSAPPGCAETVIVVRRAGIEVDMTPPRDIFYHDLVRQNGPEAPITVMEATDPLFLLFTSGATGRPKAVVHTHGGFMVGLDHTMRTVFDIKDTDIHFCTADPGWITGHGYGVYGPLLRGATTLLYEGHPLYPQADRLWSIVARHGATILYTTPTTVRLLMRFGPRHPKAHDIGTLRLLASVGEPLAASSWLWLYKHVGRSLCPVLDTWWQTETGMVMIAPHPVSTLKPGSVGRPLPGVEADVVDRAGRPVGPGRGGYLVLKKPWPGMLSTLDGDPDGYRANYWDKIPGMYFAGDVARKDEDGHFFIQGRADDVLNIAGHRIGNAEIESALTSHRAVAEAAVIGVPDALKGEVAKAFIIPVDGFEGLYGDEDALRADLARHLRRELGPVVVLGAVAFRTSLPRTRSGKILRRALRAEELGEDPGDVSTLDE